MTYSVKEIFYTLQGEGLQAGRAAVFCRFAGCNLWSGREADRGQAICQFCDTDFVGTDGTHGGKFESAVELAQAVKAHWPATQDNHANSTPMVVLTGGEPGLQVDTELVNALHDQGFFVAIESNGSVALPQGIDWICISPKAGAPWVQRHGHELKLVFPQPQLMPNQVEAQADLQFNHWLLQPMDSPMAAQNSQAAIDYCQAHPRWRLSVQTHKILGIR
jgi:7-carboxy-7-deazaguanine synthase (Cx14CxxC type)